MSERICGSFYVPLWHTNEMNTKLFHYEEIITDNLDFDAADDVGG